MMLRLYYLLFCLLLTVISFTTKSQAPILTETNATEPHIEVSLISDSNIIVPNKVHWLGVRLSPDEHWHTYWQNPGDSGEAPVINWQSNADIEFGDIQWPIPISIQVAHLVNYGYSADNVLLIPITLKDKRIKNVSITADLSWLVCKEDCIPGWATLSLSLGVGNSRELSEHDAEIEKAKSLLPSNELLSGHYELNDTHIALEVAIPYYSDSWQLFPIRGDIIQHNSQQTWQTDKLNANVLIPLSDYLPEQISNISFLLSDGQQGYYLTTTVKNQTTDTTDLETLLVMMLFALVGGLILNIMPCVLPVLSLKAMALAQPDNNTQNHWGYPVGIMVSFWLFAALILTLKSAGHAIGWGFHLQQPEVIASLAFLFIFIALMLWDLTPNVLNISGAGQTLTQGNTFASQFFTGVLAVIVASPCTAPFMASALGVAMVSPPVHTVLIFSSLGIGFAIPMTLLSHSRRFASILPKPGAWMVHFKHFLAFPMLATVIWLVWVFLSQTSSFAQLWLLSGLLLFSLLIWLSHFCNRRPAIMLFLLALVCALLFGFQATKQTSLNVKNTLLNAFSEQKLAQLRKDNQVVFVNMTADWCITCKVNEQVALKDDAFHGLINQPNVHYMVGDWTNKNQEIFEYLQRYERSGVPLYVVYSGEQSYSVLPQVLTTQIVNEAIENALKETNNETTH